MNTEEAQILVANTSAVFSDGGVRYRIVKGRTTARQGARILRGREHMFTPLTVDFEVAPEKPKRGPGRPRKSETQLVSSSKATVVQEAPEVKEKKEAEEAPKEQ